MSKISYSLPGLMLIHIFSKPMNNATVTKSQIRQVFQDKKGLHEFLVVEMEFYLPALNFTNIEWLRGIWQGQKRVRQTIQKDYQTNIYVGH